MCIIVIKPLGVKFPDEQVITNCMTNNPNGFSMAWNVTDKKGNKKLLNCQTLDKEEFMKTYKIVSQLDYKKTAIILHCRIKTTGSVNAANCHCWMNGTYAFAHNGVLHITTREDMSDSETFFRDIFTPVYKEGGWKAADLAIKAVVDSSRFAFLDKDGNTDHMYGQYTKDLDGCFFSNESYKDTYRRYQKTTCNSWGYEWDKGENRYKSVQSVKKTPKKETKEMAEGDWLSRWRKSTAAAPASKELILSQNNLEFNE